MFAGSKFTSNAHVALAVGLLMSTGLNVALAIRSSQQRSVIETRSGQPMALVGATIREIEGVGRDGKRVRVSLTADERPTVVYVLQPGCGWCLRNSEAIQALAERAGGRNRFVAVVLGNQATDEFLDSHIPACEVLTGIDPDFVKAYDLAGTPRTLVIAPDGTVMRNWVGAYAGELHDEISAYFGVELPEAQLEGN